MTDLGSQPRFASTEYITIGLASTIIGIMDIQTIEVSNLRPPLDEGVYSLTSENATFFKSQTGIDDDETLKQHILAIQKKAYEACRHQNYSSARTYTLDRKSVV